MLKKRLIVSCLALAFAIAAILSACAPGKPSGGSSSAVFGKDVLATVDGKTISYCEFVTNKKAYDKSFEISSQYRSAAPLPSGIKSTAVKKTARQLLQDQIEDRVIQEDCEKLGITVSSDEARKTFETNMSTIQNQMKNGSATEKENAKMNWDLLQSLAKSLGMTLDEYNAEYGVKGTQDILLKTKHYQYVTSHLSDKERLSDTIQNLYQKHVQELVKKSKVEINEALLKTL